MELAANTFAAFVTAVGILILLLAVIITVHDVWLSFRTRHTKSIGTKHAKRTQDKFWEGDK